MKLNEQLKRFWYQSQFQAKFAYASNNGSDNQLVSSEPSLLAHTEDVDEGTCQNLGL